MINLEDAFRFVSAYAPIMETEKVELPDALGRVLAEDVFSDIDMPPFNKSAMDGYALRYSDIHKVLNVKGTIAAGQQAIFCNPGECVAIMTGAAVPEWADYIIPTENVEKISENQIKISNPTQSTNIAPKGQDVSQGDLIFNRGQLLSPVNIAMLAAIGVVQPLVYKKVRAVVFSTGDELVEPSDYPAGATIRNTNAYQLLAMLRQMPVDAVYGGIIRDNPHEIETKLSSAIDQFSMVVLSGGVSMGDFDFIPEILKKIGAQIVFHTIRVKPGKPTLFAIKDKTTIFALPGNPVSSLLHCKLLVSRNVYARMEHQFSELVIRMPLAVDIFIKNANRVSLIPVGINENNEVYPVEYHGSAHIMAITNAIGIVKFEVGENYKRKGEIVDVRLL
ncbi:MAG TPA: molybdopterin molybdotransferase MoeA [Salinivirgaceae bacterium]|nr:molybdopterin molybdotransferase MoeA [Salinivirgaceae bacterium]